MSTLKIKRENGKIFCPLADSWHIETPEEKVRQEYIKILVENYGYSLDQMAQEIKVNNSQRGQGKARADIVIWKSKQDKIESKAAFIAEFTKKKKSNTAYYEENWAERKERKEYYQSFTKDKLLAMTEEAFLEYISKLWSMLIWGNKKYVVDKMIADNDFSMLKKQLAELLYSTNPIEKRWDVFLKSIKGMGPATISELLTYANPQEYVTSTKNLESIINSVINAKAPERFTNKFLEDLGYKSSNDRLVIGMFKALGLLDDNGQPLQRYYEFLDQTQTGRIIAIGIEEAYEDLFNLRKDAQNLTNDEVKNKLKTITQGQKSDKILGLMAMTFRAFCDLADWDSVGTEETNKIETPHVVLKSDNTEKSQTKTVPTTTDMNLHYNIQIHLPETTNMAVYDAIFQSLKKHLM